MTPRITESDYAYAAKVHEDIVNKRAEVQIRELRAMKAARVEEAKARVRELQQLRAMLDNQITNANVALMAAERDAKE